MVPAVPAPAALLVHALLSLRARAVVATVRAVPHLVPLVLYTVLARFTTANTVDRKNQVVSGVLVVFLHYIESCARLATAKKNYS